MAETKREISGFFLSNDKFASHVSALSSPECPTTQLRLFHNEPHHSAAVLQALSSNSSVTCLDIYEVDPSAAGALSAVLSATPRLTSLAAHHLHGHAAVTQLAQGLAANRTLTHLHLSQLDSRGVAAVAGALSAWAASQPLPTPPSADQPHCARHLQTARLQHLRLDKCAFSPDAATALAAALGPQAGSLLRLELVECDLGDSAAVALLGGPGWDAIATGGVLTSLDLSSCHVGPQGAALLAQHLARSSSLTALSLANNRGLGCAGATALQPGVAASRSLRRLDLSGCGVGTAGVQALAAALRGESGNSVSEMMAESAASAAAPPPLQHLSLSDNAGGAAGLLSLLQSMSGPRPCALQTLVLDRNHIRGVELAQTLGFPTPPPPGLRSAAAPPPPPPPPPAAATAPLPLVLAPLSQLSLAGNALWDAGVMVLAAVLAAAPALEQLDLRENGISDAGVTALLPLLAPPTPRRGSGGGVAAAAGATRPALAGLLLDGNRLHNVGGQALLEAVAAAPGLWRFSAEANKLTDPALRLSLTELSQVRAARHSQVVVLGRAYSSSSSSSEENGGGPGRRGSGGGAGGADGQHPMDVDGPAGGKPDATSGGGGGGGSGGAQQGGNRQQQQQQQYQQQHLKHRLEGRSDGGACSSGDERPPLRNVAARGGEATCGAVVGCGAVGGGVSMAIDMPRGGAGAWRNNGRTPQASAYGGRGGSSGGGSSDGGFSMDVAHPYGGGSAGSSGGYGPVAAAAAASSLSASPCSTEYFVNAVTGVGGAGTVGVSKRVGTAAAGGGCEYSPAAKATPQQLLPSSRRPRYKPLTPEQQRLFADF